MLSYLFEPRSKPDYDDSDIVEELYKPSDILWIPVMLLAPFGFMLLVLVLVILQIAEHLNGTEWR